MDDEARTRSRELEKKIKALVGQLTERVEIETACHYEASLHNSKEDVENRSSRIRAVKPI
jgi:hypothetical protein